MTHPVDDRRGGAQVIPRPSVFTVEETVAPAPHPLRATVADVARAVSSTTLGRLLVPAFPDSRASAVLAVVADGTDGVEVLLTRRSMHLRNHRGEISFPGGRLDPDETPVEAALREAHEEVGLDPVTVTILGELEHLNTVVSRSYIVPIVASVPAPLPLHPQTSEVDRIMWLPLAELVRPGTYRAERWGRAPTDRRLHFYELDDETVWGATAFMLTDLLGRLAAPG